MDNNNIDMNNLVERAQEMIKNNQVPDELKAFVNQISSKSNNTTITDSSKISHADNLSSFSDLNSTSNIDALKLTNLINTISNNSNDDDISKLLSALKPYLRNQKQEKLDEYIKLIKIGKAAQLFDILGGDRK